MLQALPEIQSPSRGHQGLRRCKEARRQKPQTPPLRTFHDIVKSLQVFENGERRCEKYSGELPPCLRVNCVHPFSVASTIDHQTTPPVTVTEVVEAGWSVVGERLIGVRLLSGGSIYLSVTDTRAVAALVERGLSLREGSLLLPLHDVSQGTVVLALSGVPYTMSDTQLAQTVAQFGPIIGYIETRYYRNVDTGERLARLRPQSSLPKRLYVDSQEISVRILPHDELSKLAQLPAHIGRRSSHRVRLNIPSLKVEVTSLGGGNIAEVPPGGGVEQSTSTPSIVPQPPPTTTSTSANTATSTAANATQQPFAFPVNPPTTPTAQIQQTINKEEGDRSQSLPPGSLPATPSPSTVRRGGCESDVGGSRRIRYRPSRRGRSPEGGTASRAPSCRRWPSTRRSVVAGTQHQETTEQQAGATLGQDRERSGSLASVASARRKLSDTGREVGSLPWCGCWGNGCV